MTETNNSDEHLNRKKQVGPDSLEPSESSKELSNLNSEVNLTATVSLDLEQLEKTTIPKLLEDMKESNDKLSKGGEDLKCYTEIESKIKPILAKKLLKNPSFIPQAIAQLGVDNFRDDVMWNGLFMSEEFKAKLVENYKNTPVLKKTKRRYTGKNAESVKRAFAFDMAVRQVFGGSEEFIRVFTQNAYGKKDFDAGYLELGEDVKNKMNFFEAEDKAYKYANENLGMNVKSIDAKTLVKLQSQAPQEINSGKDLEETFMKGGIFGTSGGVLHKRESMTGMKFNKLEKTVVFLALIGSLLYFTYKAFKGKGFFKTLLTFAGLYAGAKVLTGHNVFDWAFRVGFGGLDQAVDDTKNMWSKVGQGIGGDVSKIKMPAMPDKIKIPKMSATTKRDMETARSSNDEIRLGMAGSHSRLSTFYFHDGIKMSEIKTFLTKDKKGIHFDINKYISSLKSTNPEKAEALEEEVRKNGLEKTESTLIKLLGFVGINPQNYDNIDWSLSFEEYYSRLVKKYEDQKKKGSFGIPVMGTPENSQTTNPTPSSSTNQGKHYSRGSIDTTRPIDVNPSRTILFEGTSSDMIKSFQENMDIAEKKIPLEKREKFEAIISKKGMTYMNLWVLLLSDAKNFNEAKVSGMSKYLRFINNDPVYKNEIISMLEDNINLYRSNFDAIDIAIRNNDFNSLDRILKEIDTMCDESFKKIEKLIIGLNTDEGSRDENERIYTSNISAYKSRFDKGDTFAVYEFMSEVLKNKDYNEYKLFENFEFEPVTDEGGLVHVLKEEYDNNAMNDYFKMKHNKFKIFGKMFNNPDIDYAGIIKNARLKCLNSDMGNINPAYILSEVIANILDKSENTLLSAKFGNDAKKYLKLFYKDNSWFQNLKNNYRSWGVKLAAMSVAMRGIGKIANGILFRLFGKYGQGFIPEVLTLHFGGYAAGGALFGDFRESMRQSMKINNIAYSAISIGALRSIDALIKDKILINGFIKKGTKYSFHTLALTGVTFIFNKEISAEDTFNIIGFVIAHNLTRGNSKGKKIISVEKTPEGKTRIVETLENSGANKQNTSGNAEGGNPSSATAERNKPNPSPEMTKFTNKSNKSVKENFTYIEEQMDKWKKGKITQEKLNSRLEKNIKNFKSEIEKNSTTEDQKTLKDQVIQHYSEYIEKLKSGTADEAKLAKEQFEESNKKWIEARGTQNNIGNQEKAIDDSVEGKKPDLTTEIGKVQQGMEADGSGSSKTLGVIKKIFSSDFKEFGNTLKEIFKERKIRGNRGKVVRMITLGSTTGPRNFGSFMQMLGWMGVVDIPVLTKTFGRWDDSWSEISKNAVVFGALNIWLMGIALTLDNNILGLKTLGKAAFKKAAESIGELDPSVVKSIGEKIGTIPGVGSDWKDWWNELFAQNNGQSPVQRSV